MNLVAQETTGIQLPTRVDKAVMMLDPIGIDLSRRSPGPRPIGGGRSRVGSVVGLLIINKGEQVLPIRPPSMDSSGGG